MTGLPERNRPEACLSDLTLDRLIVGELAGKPELRAVETHLARCMSCQRRRIELETEPASEVSLVWAPETRREGRAAHGPGTTRKALWRVWAAAASGLVLAAAASVVLVIRGTAPLPDAAVHSPTGGTQVKGAPFSLRVVVRRLDTGTVEPVLPDSQLHEGDAVRFRVRTPGPGYLVVLGLDGGGQVSTYAPVSGAPIRITTAGEHDLEGSIVLDGALGPEQILAVLCPTADGASREIGVAQAARGRGSASAAMPSRLASNCLQTRVSYLKTPR